MSTGTWNPRYLAYAAEHRKTPDEMLAFDRSRFPAGCMTGFLTWKSKVQS